jgi:hypothetical protein
VAASGKHHSGYENATRHKCICTECDGTLHGWPGRIYYAREPEGASRLAFRVLVDQDWASAHKGRTKKKPSQRKKAAATDKAESDIVDWMADDLATIAGAQNISIGQITDDTTDRIAEAIGKLVANRVISELEEPLASVSRERRIALTSHLWCDLLAALACGIEKFKQQLDKVPEYAVTAILESRESEGRAVDELIVRLAVQTAWSTIKQLPFFRQTDDLLRGVRILAVFICPAPENHRAVAQCCMYPLASDEAGAVIKEATKRRLMQILPPEWLPDTQPHAR